MLGFIRCYCMYTIEMFQELNNMSNFLLTRHSRFRLNERGLSVQDIVNAISDGEIIEEYENDFPYPSCLILGKSGEKVLHICASINDNVIYIITTYVPDPSRWTDSYRRRKG